MCQYRNDQATGFKGRELEQGMERDRAGTREGKKRRRDERKGLSLIHI